MRLLCGRVQPTASAATCASVVCSGGSCWQPATASVSHDVISPLAHTQSPQLSKYVTHPPGTCACPSASRPTWPRALRVLPVPMAPASRRPPSPSPKGCPPRAAPKSPCRSRRRAPRPAAQAMLRRAHWGPFAAFAERTLVEKCLVCSPRPYYGFPIAAPRPATSLSDEGHLRAGGMRCCGGCVESLGGVLVPAVPVRCVRTRQQGSRETRSARTAGCTRGTASRETHQHCRAGTFPRRRRGRVRARRRMRTASACRRRS